MAKQKTHSRRVYPAADHRCAHSDPLSRSNSLLSVFRLRWIAIAAGCGIFAIVASLAWIHLAMRGWQRAEFQLDLVKQSLNRQAVGGLETFSKLQKSIHWDEDLYQLGLDSSKETGLRGALSFFGQVVKTQGATNGPYVVDAYYSLGIIHERLHELEHAEVALTEARRLVGPINSTSTGHESDLLAARVSARLAWLLANKGKLPEAEAAGLEAVQLLTALDQRSPGEREPLFELAIALRNLGLIRLLRGADGSVDVAAAIQAGERMLSARKSAVDYRDREAAADRLRENSLVIDCCQLQMALLWHQGEFKQAAQFGSRSAELCESQLEFIREWSRWGYAMPAQRYLNALTSARENLEAISAVVASQPEDRPDRSASGALPDEWQWKSLYPRFGEVLHHGVLARGRLAGEFEQQDGLVISWADDEWCHAIMPQIAKHVYDRLELIVLVSSSRIEQKVNDSLAAAGLTPDDVALHYLPTDSTWIRDYGPLALTTGADRPKFIEAAYGGGRYNDEDLPSRLSELFHVPVVPVSLSIDWGGILSNGAGVCLVSTSMLRRNEAQGFSEAYVTDTLKRLTGADRIVYLDPMHEETTGHLDVFATFTSANTLVIGDSRTTDPANAELLDKHAARLRGMPTAAGELQVVRIPMPPRGKGYFGGSYTNVVFANGVLLVPSWPEASPDLEAEALAVYRRLLPDWKIVTIDAREFGYRGGGLHCATMNIHRLLRKNESVPTARLQN